jgi:hypothetical protein
MQQGCQIFLVHYTKWSQNVPNEHKMYQMNTKWTKWSYWDFLVWK